MSPGDISRMLSSKITGTVTVDVVYTLSDGTATEVSKSTSQAVKTHHFAVPISNDIVCSV